MASILILAGQHVQSAEFIALGMLPGTPESRARGVSDDGVVGGSVVDDIGGEREGFRWAIQTGMVGLGTLPDAWASTVGRHGVSGDGTVIAGRNFFLNSDGTDRWEASVHTAADGMRGLGTLPGGKDSEASAVSYDGSVVVGWSVMEGEGIGEAFRWTEADGMVGLGRLEDETRATDVSSDGSVIVGLTSLVDVTASLETFVWTEDTGMVNIGSLGEPAVSSDGTVVAGATKFESDSNYQAIRWTADTGAIGLGWLPSTESADGSNSSVARGINADGSVIVGYGGKTRLQYRAFIWDEQSGMQDLQELLVDQYDLGPSLEGWNLYAPQDISDNGKFITGIGINPNGLSEAWLVRLDAPVPEPNSLTLALLSLSGLISLARNRKLK